MAIEVPAVWVLPMPYGIATRWRARDFSASFPIFYGGEFARQKTAPALRGQAKSAISHHPHLHQFHLAKSEMPATRRLASRITSFPRTLLVKSSWAFTPSTLLLLRIKRFGPPLVARQAPRSAQHSIITSAYRGAQRPRKKNPPGVNRRAVLCLGPGRGTAGSGWCNW